jgi:uncharacterized protein
MVGDEKLTETDSLVRNRSHPTASKRARAVLDTNILVAYALLNGSTARRHDALRRCVERVRADHGLLGSVATLAELQTVLMRPNFERYQPMADRQRFFDAIASEITLVTPVPNIQLCRDPEDDMFLAAALASDADWLVTVDRQLLSVRRVGRTPILRPERVLERMG